MAEHLLQTKLYIPPIRPLHIPRPRLINKLQQGLDGKVTLISAPAGFGKTTTLVQWLHTCEQTAVWLSLDTADNDLFTFFSYLAATVSPLPDSGHQLHTRLPEQQTISAHHLMKAFLQDVTAVSTPFILVLDDYHTITNPDIEQTISWLIAHMPPIMHLVLASRAEPEFLLSRLCVQGQLTELREVDLRFTPDESTQFLHHTMGITLSEPNIISLQSQTEGWISGLQMAALSLQHHTDATVFIQTINGSNRYILDYLTEEMLEQQPAAIQDFLLKTAVLPRLNASLCQTLTDNSNSQQILEQLEANNLFIVSLDDQRGWFRYPTLFADLLHKQLQRRYPKQIPYLHKQAARWFAKDGDARTAVHHALTANDHELAGQIIQDNWLRLYHQGWISTALHWLESSPSALRQQSPPLNIAYCWTLVTRGDTHRIPPYLAQAKAALDDLIMQEMVPDSHPEYDFWAGQFDLLRSVLARVAGDTAVAIRHAEKSSVLIPAVEEKYGSALVLLTHGTMALELGLSYQNAGDFANAKKYLHQSMLASQQSGNFMTMCACVFELCRIWHQQGHTKDAELLCRQMLTLSEQPNYMGWPAFFLVHIALANILLLHNQVAEANQQIQQGLALGQQSGHIYYLAHGYLIAERIQLAQNNKNAAQFAHQEAERLLAMVNINTVNLPVSAQPFSSSLAC